MILSKPFDNGVLVDFDTSTGEVNTNVEAAAKPKGNFHLLDKRHVAIYCENNTLTLQIDRAKWALSSADIELRYFHIFSNKTTCFEIKYSEHSVLIEYEAWWAKIPGYELVEPEMDEDEDFLAYVFAVWGNRPLQQSLINHWA